MNRRNTAAIVLLLEAAAAAAYAEAGSERRDTARSEERQGRLRSRLFVWKRHLRLA